MSEVELPQEQQNDSDHADHHEVAKNALIFALLYILMVIGLWGYVYLTLLERGMTQ
jgi:hypothetical protein